MRAIAHDDDRRPPVPRARHRAIDGWFAHGRRHPLGHRRRDHLCLAQPAEARAQPQLGPRGGEAEAAVHAAAALVGRHAPQRLRRARQPRGLRLRAGVGRDAGRLGRRLLQRDPRLLLPEGAAAEARPRRPVLHRRRRRAHRDGRPRGAGRAHGARDRARGDAAPALLGVPARALARRRRAARPRPPRLRQALLARLPAAVLAHLVRHRHRRARLQLDDHDRAGPRRRRR